MVIPALIDVTPDPGLQLGPIFIGFYGLGYALAIAAGYSLSAREAAARGLDRRIPIDAILITVVLALIGGRLYHVIDQWDYYSRNPLLIVLPPYSGLGLYGGIAGAVLAVWIFTRRRRLPFLRWADIGVPGLLLGQAIARWGNFFNQELYGTPTDVPWAIPIECRNRVAEYACPPGSAPDETFDQGFHPLFFYESAFNLLGVLIALWLPRRFAGRLRDGDLVSFWLIWYGAGRSLLEQFRQGYNWTLGGAGGIPTAVVIGVVLVIIGLVTIWLRRTERFGTDVSLAPGTRAIDETSADAMSDGTPGGSDRLATDAPVAPARTPGEG